MDAINGFHQEEMNGKPFLVYHHPKYHPIPQTQNLISSGEAASHDLPLQPLFLCPDARVYKDGFNPLSSSPEYVHSTSADDSDLISLNSSPNDFDHPVLPLYWCNNKDFDVNSKCRVCNVSDFATDYYFCEHHKLKFHKECVESPLKIKHPYHPEHSLQLYFNHYRWNLLDLNIGHGLCCGTTGDLMVYYCTICQVFMHPICTMKPIPFVIDPPKRHDHPLTFFPRQTSLTCNVCGMLRKISPTYVCLICNFVAHRDCMYFPHIIKISRHHHRISYISSLRSSEWPCGVCRQRIDCDYGAYTCDTCSDYAVHSGCALGKNVWDGEELQGVPEKDDITQDASPFDIISEGVILHFLHNHHLRLEVNILYDENKFCHACVLPIYEGNLYSCTECEFILHETCCMAPRRIQHALHPHPLTLKAVSGYIGGCFLCNACNRNCGGFVYQCYIGGCSFDLDARCASVSEPFDYKGHEHPLFLALDPVRKPICQVCKTECQKQYNCIKCNFIVCMWCATRPYKARYKHDQHFLTLLYGDEKFENDCCEVCEHDLGYRRKTKVFYWCKECSTTFHIECLLGDDPYMKPGQSYKAYGKEFQVLGISKISRPFCSYCKNRCQDKLFKGDCWTACSMYCNYRLSM